MGTNKTRVPIRGKMVEGVDVRYEQVKEDWNEYKLEDGTILKIKTVLSRVVRTEEYDQNGEPIYFFNTSTVGATIVPDELKKK